MDRKETVMKSSIVSAVAGCILGLSGLADAAQIASPTIYGAFHQDTAECVVRNVGKSNVTVDVKILDESGNAVASNGNCTAPITPGYYCFTRTPISAGVAYACTATLAGSAKDLRASLVLIDDLGSDEFPLRSVNLR
jgi:hypothetical protein